MSDQREKSTFFATVYTPPFGKKSTIEFSNIYKDDADQLAEWQCEISMEQLVNEAIAVYIKHPKFVYEDGEPDEFLDFARPGDKCEDLISNMVKVIKQRLENENQ